MIRAVLFDLDGTLYDFYTPASDCLSRIIHHALTGKGLPPAAAGRVIDNFWQEQYPHFLEYTGPGVDADALVAEMFRRAFVACSLGDWAGLCPHLAAAWRREFLDAIRPREGVTALLSQLRRHGVPVAVVSNGLGAFQAEKIARLRLTPYFPAGALYTSAEYGAAKPETCLFLAPLAKMGLDAGEAVLVGDSYFTDVVGAIAAGLRVIWLNPTGWLPPGGLRAVITVASFPAAARAVLNLVGIRGFRLEVK